MAHDPTGVQEDVHAISYTTYTLVWGALVALTLLLSAVSVFHLKDVPFLTPSLAAFIISPIKAGLVVFYFMHLKYETNNIYKIMLVITLGILIIFLGLTWLDVALR
ncbi:MAG: cytochrome C oxidase subunit IV family protein [Acidobacteriota bacterium]|jgi:cytochrome c oxidase subunit IV